MSLEWLKLESSSASMCLVKPWCNHQKDKCARAQQDTEARVPYWKPVGLVNIDWHTDCMFTFCSPCKTCNSHKSLILFSNVETWLFPLCFTFMFYLCLTYVFTIGLAIFFSNTLQVSSQMILIFKPQHSHSLSYFQIFNKKYNQPLTCLCSANTPMLLQQSSTWHSRRAI